MLFLPKLKPQPTEVEYGLNMNPKPLTEHVRQLEIVPNLTKLSTVVSFKEKVL